MELQSCLAELDSGDPLSIKEALTWARKNWPEIKPRLLEEMKKVIADPLQELPNVLFLHACFLCAEMREKEAFSLYLDICRLPPRQLDWLLDDLITEDLNNWLALTAHGRTDEVKEIIAERRNNDYARSAAVLALQKMVLSGEMNRDALMNYCLHLAKHKLEKYVSPVWDAIVECGYALHPSPLMPVIRSAVIAGFVENDESYLAELEERNNQPVAEIMAASRREYDPAYRTEEEMEFIYAKWDDEDDLEEEEDDSPESETVHSRPVLPKRQIGRNDPCPCGSGKKYKKCCWAQDEQNVLNISIYGETIPDRDQPLVLAMDKGYAFMQREAWSQAIEWWYPIWSELQQRLRPDMDDLMDTQSLKELFQGRQFLSNWLQDLVECFNHRADMNLIAALDGLELVHQLQQQFSGTESEHLLLWRQDEADFYIKSGQTEKAISIYRDMIRDFPGSAAGYVLWAELLTDEPQRCGLVPDYDAAIEMLSKARDNAQDAADWGVEYRLAEKQSEKKAELEDEIEWEKMMEQC